VATPLTANWRLDGNRRFAELAAVSWMLSKKNFKVRYKRAALGVVWAVLQPTIQAVVLALIFSRVFKAGIVPHYPAFVISGLLPWTWFSQSMSQGTVSIVENASLVQKVAVPMLVYPLSAVGGSALASSAAIPIILAAAIASGTVSAHLLLIVPAVLIELMVILGFTTLTSALYPAYRDVRYLVESGLLIGFYATPVLYSPLRLPPAARDVLLVNPMGGVMQLFHYAVLGQPIDGRALLTSIAGGVLLLVVGIYTFNRRAGNFADIV
jgi:lipopolysaccharide transport system permease protein